MGVAFSSRFPDDPLFESPLELEEFFRVHSPSPPPSPDVAAEPGASSNPDSQRPGFQLRSILKDRSAGDSFPLVEPPQEPTRDDPAMRPVSPASPAEPEDSTCPSPAYSKTNSSLSSCTPSPPRTPVPPGFRPDGLMEAGIPRQPSADSPGPSPSSPVLSAGRFAPNDSPPSLVGSPCSAAEDESTPTTVAELWSLLQRQERARRDHEKNQARLTAYALLRPPTSSDAGFHRDLLSAESASRMLEILQADAPEPPCSTKELAELRVRDAQLTRENNALTRRMETAVVEASRLSHKLAVVVRERDEWKKEGQRHTELITFFRKIVCTHEAQMREMSRQSNRRVDSSQMLVDHLRRMVETRDKDLDRLMGHLKERDVAYTALQGVSSSYFAQIQEAAQVVSSGGLGRALRFANQTIHEQRQVIQQQKNILRHNGQIAVTDPALTLAAAAGLDAPGLSPSELAINARLCRLLEARWPGLARISDDELREVTLRVSGLVAPVNPPVSTPTPNPVIPASSAEPDESTLDFDVPSVEPRRVPESRYARDHLTPATRPSVRLPTTPSTTSTVSGAAVSVAAVSQVSGQTLLGSTDSSGDTAGASSAADVNTPPRSTPAPPAAATPNSAPSPAIPAPVVSASTKKKKTKASQPASSAAAEPSSSSRSVKSSQPGAKSTKSAGTKKSISPRTTGKRMAAQNARVLQALEIQTLEASDDAVLGNADGTPSASADNPVIVGSSSASSESDQTEELVSSAAHSAASSADSDSESGDSADRSARHLKDAKALEALHTWSTKMKDANANDGDDDDEEEDEELEDKPAPPAQVDNSTSATPAASSSSRGGTKRVRQSSPRSSSKKARKTSTAAKSKSSSVKPDRPSRFRPSQPRRSRHPLSQLRTSQRPPSRPRQSQRRPSLLRTSQRPPSRLWLKPLSRVQHRPASRLAAPPALTFPMY
ncbi:hypothetical protein PF007_g23276 [Phytophthora fragariae]|uniref:Uncharacterized protein n=1 Tax=Phytophthora fragariae TaxID=53985 RepID=A0A6A3RWA3_9STRA|nr:hypothetical protein PF003_g27283 [Phytophthora fragariae]KAE8928510.1 hypothetical protein PF009_g21352 [Phytophthora fragariae]KAE9079863.1 hypothetical protein PF007_g23276 [Phytophthora fragariae]KAE9104719.1 hypothetical protein PF006_g21832 [Phytophthora fragariae]